MFGHDDKNDDNQQSISTKPVNPGLLGIDEDTETESPTTPEPAIIAPTAPALPTTPDPVTTTTDPASVAPVNSDSTTSADPASSTDSTNSDSTTQITDSVDSAQLTTPTSEPTSSSNTTFNETTLPNVEPATNEQLVSIKRQALQELSPLINHLEQSSEDKFKTTMMMIQASDDKDLIPQAFNSAKEITDEKRRAQALLDLVNEINYFTQKT